METWEWDTRERLGGGGFGEVFAASGPKNESLAAKVVPKAAGSTREQLIGQDSLESPHIVPILHVEETPDAFVLFMPRADYSLRQKIGRGIAAGEAIAILLDIAQALSEIAPSVVHRDVKPDNVLFWQGNWALCDFGIARYAEAATAEDTRKFALSASYAAPEQWRYEHATSATDVYAFGVLAYELLSGERPFSGSYDELRTQHLSSVPALLPGNRKLSWIVSECLQKAPEARPTAANLLVRLRRAGEEAASKGASSLAAAQSAVLEARATEQAQIEVARTERERREALAGSARLGYSALTEELVEFVTDAAPATSVTRQADGVTLGLGDGRQSISPLSDVPYSNPPYDVISYGSVRLEGGGMSRSHSLYYGDLEAQGSYAWFELGFMSQFGADFQNEPRAMAPGQGLGAFQGVVGGVQLAWGLEVLDIGDLDRFLDFWADRFGKAANGRFPRLSSLPDGQTKYPPRR